MLSRLGSGGALRGGAALLGVGGRRSSSETALAEDAPEDPSKRRIADYSKYISHRSALRQPSITRIMTNLAYSSGKKLISLGEGMPNEDTFPFEEILITLKDGNDIRLRDKDLNSALQYMPSQGLPKLLNTLRNFQKKVHDPPDWVNKDIIITSGSQDGIYKSAEMLINRGDPVLVQNPLYSGTDIVLKPYKPHMIVIKQDKKGVIPEHLREVLQKQSESGKKMPKVLYLNPTGNNPTGSVIPNSRRQEIYDLACIYDLIIMEDDPYHFMHFLEEDPKSFLSYDVEGRVLRFDSLSKVLSSGLRMGWVTGPKPLINIIELHMQASYLHASTLTQVITDKLFDMWGYEGVMDHLSEVKDFYKTKRNNLIELMEKHLSGLADWNIPDAGMFVWLQVRGVPDVYDMIVDRAFNKGITFAPGHAFSAIPGIPCPYIRVSYSRANPADMEEAIIRLAQLIREEQKIVEGTNKLS